MKIRRSLFILSFSAGIFAFTSCQDNNRQNEADNTDLGNYDTEMTEQNRADQERLERENNSITSRISDNQELSTFSQGMTRAELDDDFRASEGPYTIFAPSNVAYDELSQEEKNQFEAIDTERAGASMHYLVVNEELTSDELRQKIENANGSYSLNTLQGEQITATLNGNNIVLTDASGNTATITDADLDASNGTIHVVDRLLKPQDNTQSRTENKDWNTRNDQMNYEQGDDRNDRTLNTGTNTTGDYNANSNNNAGTTNSQNNNNNSGNTENNNTGNTNNNNNNNNSGSSNNS